MIRPILFETSNVDVVDMWAFISVHLALYGIFLFASWLICKQSMTENESISVWSFCLSAVVGLILLPIYGLSLTTVKGMILILLLLYASISDIKSRIVPNCIPLMILILSFVGFKSAYLLSMVVGALIVFIPQIVLAVINPQRACGGADLKISTTLAFVLGAEKGIFALIVGMLFAVIVISIYNKVKEKDQKESFPLVPFLSVGAIIAYMI